MKLIPMLLVAAAAVFVSCERHDWNETKKLHEKHGHGAAHGDAHTDGHGTGGSHGH